MSEENKKIPLFKSIQEEADFWDTHSINDYLPELKETRIEYRPKVKKESNVVLRMEPELKKRLSALSRKKGITLSTLVRIWLIEKLRDETSRQKTA
ncbi:BrnA antitoxin family protein [bacterium]|nr:BrnA antitoxin family protein [bacterium]